MSLLRRCLLSTQRAKDKQVLQLIPIVRDSLLTVRTFRRVLELKSRLFLSKELIFDNFLSIFRFSSLGKDPKSI